ncbi:MAG: hypothetical protein APF80_11085 [Alphaproteobacteria bacterium BRH_c36]|nr:MAG: hypothetical protein APF80_11085 [Alphaproteobacteria bacterium BRH_c36]
MTLLIAVLAAALSAAAPAIARDCTTWNAALEELEEGRALVASVCAKDDERTIVMIRCFPPGLNVRYMPATENEFANFQRHLILETDEAERPVFVTYEGLDGAFSAYLPVGHTEVEMLKTGKTVTIRDPQEKAPSHAFSLGGSRQAIETLEKSCR